jgi:hypothetical protein
MPDLDSPISGIGMQEALRQMINGYRIRAITLDKVPNLVKGRIRGPALRRMIFLQVNPLD